MLALPGRAGCVTFFASSLLLIQPLSKSFAQASHGRDHECAVPIQSPAGTKCTRLPNGDAMYYGRVLMTTPSENGGAFANRQSTLFLPLMVDDDGKNPEKGAPPVIQLHIESASPVGPGDSMEIYQTYRDEIDGLFRIIVNAETYSSGTNTPHYAIFLTSL